MSLLLWVGCDDDSDKDGRTNTGDALYAVSSNSYSADFTGETSSLWLVDDLSKGKLSADDATELQGGATLWGVPGSGVLYVVTGEDLSLTKYTVAAGGQLKEQGRVGLASHGISVLIGESLVFDGADRGFLFEMQSAQALVIDLSAMEITDSIDLSSAAIDELTVLAGPEFRKHGDLWVNAAYGVNANYDHVSKESKLLLLDPKAGTVEVKDAPCGGLGFSVARDNGDIFFASDPFVAAVHELDEDAAPAPCMARLPHDSDDFAEDTIALDDLTGAPTGGVVAGPSGSAYLRVLDSTPKDMMATELYSASIWQTWRVDLDDPGEATRVERSLQSGNIKVFEVDDTTYENVSGDDLASTRLVPTAELDDEDASANALQMPGVTWGVVRLR